ncbi:MAG: isopenicillin N synthase family oxygenase [Gammaproteobacteria bacterium]|nr:isopenicillin N synthase family oxygenase [Gammaproteobacteria bacterium]
MSVRTIDFRSTNAGQQFALSLHETGFAILRNHPLEPGLLERMYEEWAAFFANDDKHRYRVGDSAGPGGRSGYFPQSVSETAVGHSSKDLKEFFHILPGGSVPPQLQSIVNRYRDAGHAIGETLLRWLHEHSPASVSAELSEPLTDMLCDQMSLLRVLHYPPLDGTEAAGAERAAPHEDINLLTLLPATKEPGLQVRYRDGQWMDVFGNSGELIVNSGDMLQEATRGYYPSASHRVLNPPGEGANVSRISIPFFLAPRADVRLSERYTSQSYLDERLKIIHR